MCTFLGVHIIRIEVFWSPPILGNYHFLLVLRSGGVDSDAARIST